MRGGSGFVCIAPRARQAGAAFAAAPGGTNRRAAMSKQGQLRRMTRRAAAL